VATGPSIDPNRYASGSDETAYRANVTRVGLLIASSVERSLLSARRSLSWQGNEGENRASRGVFPLLESSLPVWMADFQITFYIVSVTADIALVAFGQPA
jgi:hypothetical protein